MTTFSLSTLIDAAPEVVYEAFTKPAVLNLWLSNSNRVDARVGGAFLFEWTNDSYAVGEFTALQPHHKVAFTWQAKDSSVKTHITATLTPQGDSTRLEIELSDEAEKARFEESLECLTYTLENGLDMRLMRRPMLGIYPSELDTATKERLGVPVDQGMALGGVLAGMGAEKAGLQKDDVIVTMDGRFVGTYNDFTNVVSTFRGGQTVQVEFYRGGNKHSVPMTLSERPKPELPANAEEAAAKFREANATALQELQEMVAGVPESVLMQRPAPKEWSVNEVLAHVTWNEKYQHISMWALASGEDHVPYVGNDDIHLAGILKVYPTSAEILNELERAFAATTAIVSTMGDKVAVHRVLAGVLSVAAEGALLHSRSHHDQIKAAIEAAKQTEAAV